MMRVVVLFTVEHSVQYVVYERVWKKVQELFEIVSLLSFQTRVLRLSTPKLVAGCS